MVRRYVCPGIGVLLLPLRGGGGGGGGALRRRELDQGVGAAAPAAVDAGGSPLGACAVGSLEGDDFICKLIRQTA